MQSENHAEGQDGTLVQKEKLKAGLVFGWGIGTFIVVLIIIAALSGYFWDKRAEHFTAQVGEKNTFSAISNELQATVNGRLQGYKKLGDGRYQIPIDEAMKKVVAEGL